MMKVIAKLKPEAGLWASTADIPKPAKDEVLIKIKKTAICGTDLHIYKWDAWAQATIPVPMHVGHEFVGEIVELGADVKDKNDLSIGDRVSGEGHITCGKCRNCRGGKRHLCRNTIGVGVHRPGAFAEYLAIPAFNVFKVPDDIEDDLVAIFDPYGNAVHTALSFTLLGEDVLITGAGPIGLMCVAICKHVGARNVVVTDINEYRLDLASKLGANQAINVSDCKDQEATARKIREQMGSLNMVEGFDVGLEISGFGSAINAMVNVMNTGGRIALLGLSAGPIAIDWNKVVFSGLFLKGIYGREIFETWYKMVELIQGGLNLKPIITHHFPADEFEKGFETMNSGQCGKVILDWE